MQPCYYLMSHEGKFDFKSLNKSCDVRLRPVYGIRSTPGIRTSEQSQLGSTHLKKDRNRE